MPKVQKKSQKQLRVELKQLRSLRSTVAHKISIIKRQLEREAAMSGKQPASSLTSQ